MIFLKTFFFVCKEPFHSFRDVHDRVITLENVLISGNSSRTHVNLFVDRFNIIFLIINFPVINFIFILL